MKSFSCNASVKSKKFYDEADAKKVILEKGEYTVKVTYPFDTGFNFSLTVGENGMTFMQFLVKLKRNYKAYYESIHAGQVNDGYWHGIEDLFLEQVDVDGNNITLCMGS